MIVQAVREGGPRHAFGLSASSTTVMGQIYVQCSRALLSVCVAPGWRMPCGKRIGRVPAPAAQANISLRAHCPLHYVRFELQRARALMRTDLPLCGAPPSMLQILPLCPQPAAKAMTWRTFTFVYLKRTSLDSLLCCRETRTSTSEPGADLK